MLATKNLNILKQQHPFHLVDPSPYPLMASLSIFGLVISFIMYFNHYNMYVSNLVFSLFSVCYCLFKWFYNVTIEATFEGYHTKKVQQGIRLGMFLFILSEVMFFFSFFWAFFHYSIAPSIWIGGVWPPMGIFPLDLWGLPFLNTIILLSSGVSVTYAHYAICVGLRGATTKALIITIFYGVIFTGFQLFEYNSASFSMNDSVYGSIFYMTTGFHGLHVFVGSVFLIVSLIRHYNYHFTKSHHIGFECAIWYWHFVDVVWIFLFIFVYWWGSYGARPIL